MQCVKSSYGIHDGIIYRFEEVLWGERESFSPSTDP